MEILRRRTLALVGEVNRHGAGHASGLLLEHRQPAQQRIAAEAAALPGPAAPTQGVQPAPIRLEAAAMHRLLLELALRAVGQHVRLALVLRQLHPHRLVKLLPGLVDELLLQLAQHAPRRADQILRASLAHLLERRFGGDAPVHHPRAPRLAIHPLDLGQELAERGLVGRVARHHLVRQRQAVGRHYQGDHHLPAIAAPIAVVAVPGLGDLLAQSLEVGAGQIVQQHVKRRVEQRLPLLGDELAEGIFVLEDPVQAAIESILAGHREVHLQQLVHGAAQKPLAMDAQLAAGIDQAVDHQQLQHLGPGHLAARVD